MWGTYVVRRRRGTSIANRLAFGSCATKATLTNPVRVGFGHRLDGSQSRWIGIQPDCALQPPGIVLFLQGRITGKFKKKKKTSQTHPFFEKFYFRTKSREEEEERERWSRLVVVGRDDAVDHAIAGTQPKLGMAICDDSIPGEELLFFSFPVSGWRFLIIFCFFVFFFFLFFVTFVVTG